MPYVLIKVVAFYFYFSMEFLLYWKEKIKHEIVLFIFKRILFQIVTVSLNIVL